MQAGVVWLAPAVMSSFYLYQAFHSTKLQERITKAAIAAVLLIGMIFLPTATAKVLPVAIQLLLMHFFGRTLFAQHAPPLIERFVRLEFTELPANMVAYSRLLTLIWTGFFALNALICIFLTFFAPVSWWAIYTGVGIFLLTVLLMIAEYVYRHFKFPELEFPDLKSSLQNRVMNCRSIFGYH
jgi:uncharacterized membrane protein